jgi:hypothetical protein
MLRYQYVVMTSPVPGQEDAYNEWYTNTHLKEVLEIPGFKTGRRYRLHQSAKAPVTSEPRYMAVYEIESDDIKATLGEMRRRGTAGELSVNPALDRSKTVITLYELIAERHAGG